MKTFCKLTAQSPAASYVPLPRFLLQDETLRDISNDAKVLYALLLDRASISRQNGYVEPDGTIRLYFTLEQAQTKLHRSRQSATRIFRELEYSGLIIRKKQGLGKPALITLNYPSDAKLIAKEGEDAQACPHRAAAGWHALPLDAGAAPQRARSCKALLQLLGWRVPAAGQCLPAVHLSKSALPVVSPRRAAPTAETGTGYPQPEKAPPLRGLRHGHPRPLRQDKILPRLRQGGAPPAEGKIRPQTTVEGRQFGGEKPLNGKPSRTAKAARQYDFPRSLEIEFYLST